MLRKDPFITGESYHIYNRGVDKRSIFKTENDYNRFIMLLYICNSNEQIPLRLDNLINHSKKTFQEILVLEKGQPLVSIGIWCLMTNHFHIFLKQEVDGGITKFMKKLGTGYSMFFNIKYERTGALFGGPFKSKLIGEDDGYLIQLFGYGHLNPLEIKFPDWEKDQNINNEKSIEMKKFLESYRYSSYQDYIGINREEKNILNKQAFPPYFQDKQSFEKFIESYYKSLEL